MSDGQFPVKSRGYFREELLATYRWGLRRRTNPATGVLFTEAEIGLLCAEHGHAWLRADAIDAVLMLDQQRGLWLLAQLDPTTASTGALKKLWSELWDLPYLPAAGASGTVSAPAPASTPFVGSTIIGDPIAVWGVAQGGPADGKKFQVLFTVISPGDGSNAVLTVAGVDTGLVTNLDQGTKIKWGNAPDIVTALASVSAKFTGGNAAETDQEFGQRMVRRIRHKPAAANNARVVSWIEDASTNAIALGFTYACLLHGGSGGCAFLQKRGNIQGPTGRIPTAGTLAIATARLVSPGSPVMPAGPMVWVVPVIGVPSNLVIDLSMAKGSTGGWDAFQPFPGQFGGSAPAITVVTNQTHFRMSSTLALPAGITQPSMMVWNDAISRFERLAVQSVVSAGGILYDVVLSALPTKTLVVGDWISPWTEKAALIGVGTEEYFDTLGPGELVAATDSRWHRAFRFPQPTELAPQRAGTAVLNVLGDKLGGSLADADLAGISVQVPPIPADPRDGPRLIVAGKLSISAL